MNKFSRRNLLKSLSVPLIAGGTFGVPRVGFSQTGNANGVLVFIFQRGGNDGLNMLVPDISSIDDRTLYELHRPTINIATNNLIPLPGSSDGYALNNIMAGLQTPLNDRKLSFFPGTHVASSGQIVGNMSHFVAQDIMDAGGGGRDFGAVLRAISDDAVDEGWIARVIRSISAGSSSLNAYGFKADRSFNGLTGDNVFYGDNPEVGIPSTYGVLGDYEKVNKKNLENKLLKASSDSKAYPWVSLQQRLFSFTSELQSFEYAPPRRTAAPNFNNPHSYSYTDEADDDGEYHLTEMGTLLSRTATLIKSSPALEVVSINQGDYDTHNDQNRRQNLLLKDLADNLGAFYSDMNGHGKPIEVVVVTEFGRTFDQNANGGTDHGQGYTAMVMGAGSAPAKEKIISYGHAFADKPALSQLIFQRGARFYSKPIQDYRDILSEILVKRLGVMSNPFEFNSSETSSYTYQALNFLADNPTNNT